MGICLAVSKKILCTIPCQVSTGLYLIKLNTIKQNRVTTEKCHMVSAFTSFSTRKPISPWRTLITVMFWHNCLHLPRHWIGQRTIRYVDLEAADLAFPPRSMLSQRFSFFTSHASIFKIWNQL